MTKREVTERHEKRVIKSTLVITNAIKLTGLVLFVEEWVSGADPFRLALCVVLMSGIQGLEQAVVVFIQKFFGVGEDDK